MANRFLSGVRTVEIAQVDSPYTASGGEFVIADATAGAITIVMPDVTPINGLIGVSKIDSTTNIVDITTETAQLTGRFGGPDNSFRLWDVNEQIHFIRTATAWATYNENLTAYSELFYLPATASPWLIPDVLTRIPIEPFFLPFGTSALFKSVTGGQLVAAKDFSLSINYSVDFDLTIPANNNDVQVRMGPTTTAAGAALLLPVTSATTAPRIVTLGDSRSNSGRVVIVEDEEVDFKAFEEQSSGAAFGEVIGMLAVFTVD